MYDMHFAYGFLTVIRNSCNIVKCLFASINVSDSGSCKKLTGVPRTVLVTEGEEAVLHETEENPTTSSRTTSNTSRPTMFRILKNHFSSIAPQYLNTIYSNRWILRVGAQRWPPIENVQELRNRITVCCETIRNTPGIFERVRQSIHHRIDSCIGVREGHFQQICVIFLVRRFSLIS